MNLSEQHWIAVAMPYPAKCLVHGLGSNCDVSFTIETARQTATDQFFGGHAENRFFAYFQTHIDDTISNI